MSKISEWSVSDQPIHKLQQKGKAALSDAEILSLIIGNGNKFKNSIDISKEMLAYSNNDFNMIAKMTVSDITKLYGIGKSKATSIVAAFEISNRRQLNDAMQKEKISSSKDIFNLMNPKLADLQYEEFWIILLNRAHKILSIKKVGQGGVSGTIADPKIIFNFALQDLASSIVLCHNHPSGNYKPSSQDNNLTKKVKEGGKLLDIDILDHVIIGENNYYSYADEGEL